ncbi:MAG: YCF48-related protein [Candidatus Eiseniibacteriota bacterium]
MPSHRPMPRPRRPRRAPSRATFLRALGLALAHSVIAGAWLVPWSAGVALAQGGWVTQSSGTLQDLNGVSFVTADLGHVVGDGGLVLQTTDGGDSWAAQASGTSDNLNAVAFGDLATGVAVGTGLTILRTADGGATWTVVQTGFLGTLHGVDMLDGQRGFVGGVNAIFEGFIGRTTNGGASWQFVNFRFNGAEGTVRDVCMLGPMEGVAVANTFLGEGAIVRTTDGGLTWPLVLTTPQALYGLDFDDASTGVAVGQNGALLRTTDGGQSWSPLASGTGVTLGGASVPAPGAGFAVGGQGVIVHTTDGVSWSPQASGTTVQLQEVACVDPLVGWVVGDGGTILHTVTGGETPTAISAGGEPGATPGATLALRRAAPNPFSAWTSIEYELPRAARVEASIVDVTGRCRRSVDLGTQMAGAHRLRWDGRGADGTGLPAGVYLVRLRATGPGGRLVERSARLVRVAR